MSTVQLHLLHAEESADFGELRLASRPGDEGVRLVVWDGIPPEPVPDHAGIAPIVLQGDTDGRRVYAERVPRGLRLSDIPLPQGLAPFVGVCIVRAVEHLRQGRAVHGMLDAQRVMLGADGSVTLFGRGRRPGAPADDDDGLLALLRVLGLRPPDGTLAEICRVLQESTGPEDDEVLAALVATHLPTAVDVLGHLTVQVGPSADSLDEVLPDIGTDPVEDRGLFDPYTPASTTGDGERTAELSSDDDAATAADEPLSLSLWTRLAAQVRSEAPPGRFRAVAGEPSAGLRALLAREAPATLPASIGGVVPPFLLLDHDEDITPSWPLSVPSTDPGTGPRATDGDTAVYDAAHPALRAARQTAAAEERLASLETRLAEVERRAAAGREQLPPGEPPWVGFLRVEIVIAAVLGALAMWLLQRLIG